MTGIRALLVHAISADAKAFYEKHGFCFRSSPIDPLTLTITFEEAEWTKTCKIAAHHT